MADPNLSPFIWSVADSTRGATNQDSGLTQMIRIQSALPPLSVQREIVKSLHAATRRPIAMIAEGNKTITLFQERCSALISAAVTGQIDFRNYSSKGATA